MGLICPIDPRKLLRVGESLTLRRRGSGKPHKGLDLFAPAGTSVLSPLRGRVLRVVNGMAGRKSQQRAGYFVDIEGSDRRIYRLLHLAPEVLVNAEARVEAGQQIGSVGARGTSGILHAQPHLHFEIARSDYDSARQDYGERIDPLTVLLLRQQQTERFAMADIDWKGILNNAIDIGGPVIGAAINAEAPGAGTAVAAGLPLLKEYVVEPYVPGTSATKTEPAKVAPAQAALPPSSAQQTAMAVLQRKGWSPDEVQQHMQGPDGDTSLPAPMPELEPDHGALVVHGVLHEAGWHPDARRAILHGPYAFAEYLKPRQHVPTDDEIERFEQHDVDALMQADLHHKTERGGHCPQLYHGTDEAQWARIGEDTEHPRTSRSRNHDRS